MTKFIASVARRFAECVDFLDEMNDENLRAARSHARSLTADAKRATRAIAMQLELNQSELQIETLTAERQRARYKIDRLERNLTRARERATKRALRETLTA